ncbi:TraK family protein [Pseudoduganella ginsengisoli]|uniref:TraK n=1 Tax=Pseudoduganella ginsengisoli TaxID=1462440 RepID=A0A6L6Q527_9BURK|nr:TraK family protein [Pseudoduganella ginsengisoli]MTW04993.1 traK [Pseudoduganella ginsengisoli]
MAKNYVSQLGEWVASQPATQKAKNLTAFLAVRDDVRDALNAAYSVKTVWAHLYESKRIDIKYDAFLGYVHRYLQKSGQQSESSDSQQSGAAGAGAGFRGKPAGPASRSEPRKLSVDMPGFVFNPIPNKDELL